MTTEAVALYNVSFTEEGEDVPRRQGDLPSPIVQIGDLHITSDRLFSEAKLPIPFSRALNANYLRMTLESNESGTMTFFGWIESVEMISDSEDLPVTLVRWHVDLWRTYFSNASISRGHFIRRPWVETRNNPIQNYTRLYEKIDEEVFELVDKVTDFESRGALFWVLVTFIDKRLTEMAGQTIVSISYIRHALIPIARRNSIEDIRIDVEGESITAILAQEIVAGRLEETLGLDPNAITNVTVLPFPPYAEQLGWTEHGLQFTNIGPRPRPWQATKFEITFPAWPHSEWRACWLSPEPADFSKDNIPIEKIWPGFRVSLDEGGIVPHYKSEEMREYTLLGYEGEIIHKMPIGLEFNHLQIDFQVSATQAGLIIRFLEDAQLISADKCRMEGRTATLIGQSFDITENALSSYLYSGQYDYENTVRNIQSKQKGVESMLGGGTSGAIAGGFAGMGAGLGAVAGAAGGAAATALDLAVFNSEHKNANFEFRANQTNGILGSGQGAYIAQYGIHPRLVIITADDDSQERHYRTRSLYGVAVDEWEIDCSDRISYYGNGYYQIMGAQVEGNIPAEARRYIATRLARGVRIR